MEKYSRESFKNIQQMVQEETGAKIAPSGSRRGRKVRRMALLALCLLCAGILSASAHVKFSDLNGDQVGFAAAYQGGGRFEIAVINNSDRELKLQEKVKVMQWSTAGEVEGEKNKIRMEVPVIPPHAAGVISIDLSEGYDMEMMEKNLPEGDGYYFVLTNNYFAFGQDWMCFFDFETESVQDAGNRLAEHYREKEAEAKNPPEQSYETGSLKEPGWSWPTVSRNVSTSYGEQANGSFSDHINIAGEEGDEIYAVAQGTVTEVSFESAWGNTVVLDLGEGVQVKYGHLEEVRVLEGDRVEQSQVIGTMGRTGKATGPNLFFRVTVEGEAVDPLEP